MIAVPVDRKTIDEIVTLYILEPSLTDIYVEGDTDAHVIEWFLREHGRADFLVYEIQSVEIPTEEILKLGLYDNNKGRVATLASKLSEAFLGERLKVVCIVDRDTDDFLGQKFECELLLYTDYTSMEMYLYDIAVLEKFFSLGVRTRKFSAADVLDELRSCLEDLFAIRLVNESETMGLAAIDFTRCCSIKRGRFAFDRDEFIARYLQSNGAASKKLEFARLFSALRSRFGADPRFQIHGHDFLIILDFFLRRQLGQRAYQAIGEVGRTMFLCLDAGRLSQESLFRQLLERVST